MWWSINNTGDLKALMSDANTPSLLQGKTLGVYCRLCVIHIKVLTEPLFYAIIQQLPTIHGERHISVAQTVNLITSHTALLSPGEASHDPLPAHQTWAKPKHMWWFVPNLHLLTTSVTHMYLSYTTWLLWLWQLERFSGHFVVHARHTNTELVPVDCLP